MNKIARQLQADWPNHLSYDVSDSNVDRFYSIVNGAITEKNSIFYHKRQINIFLLAMAIGKELDNRKPIKKSSQSIRRDALTEEEMWLMCCLALADDDINKLEILAKPKELLKICEEYSNGGIKSLIKLDEQTDHNNRQYEEFLEKAIGRLKT